MSLKGAIGGLWKYGKHLAMVLVFPLAWLAAWRLAGRHAEADPRGRAKVGVAIALGVGLAVGGFLFLGDFRDGAVDGMYGQLDGRLSRAVGEAEYQENAGIAAAKSNTISVLEGKLAQAQAAGNQSAAATFQSALDAARADRAKAEARVAALVPNHALYGGVKADLEARDDEAAAARIAAFPSGYQSPAAGSHGIHPDAEAAFAIKGKAVADMDRDLRLWAYPGLVGLLYAPLVFALGSVLRNAFLESDTVGFKPYPGAGMGFFLLLGGFGVPATLFAAWTLMDMEGRSREGQIAL